MFNQIFYILCLVKVLGKFCQTSIQNDCADLNYYLAVCMVSLYTLVPNRNRKLQFFCILKSICIVINCVLPLFFGLECFSITYTILGSYSILMMWILCHQHWLIFSLMYLPPNLFIQSLTYRSCEILFRQIYQSYPLWIATVM